MLAIPARGVKAAVFGLRRHRCLVERQLRAASFSWATCKAARRTADVLAKTGARLVVLGPDP